MFERLFGTKEQDPAVMERIPPGQYKTDKFPVLHYGSVPHTDLATWDFKVWGEVDSPFTLTWAQFKDLPRKTVHTDIHCVTRWSKLATRWRGVSLDHLLTDVDTSALYAMVRSYGGYTTNVPLSELVADEVLLAHAWEGAPLTRQHGGPVRVVLPRLYFWKSPKWVTRSEQLRDDRPGFWEVRGYHNNGDPWAEERYG